MNSKDVTIWTDDARWKNLLNENFNAEDWSKFLIESCGHLLKNSYEDGTMIVMPANEYTTVP